MVQGGEKRLRIHLPCLFVYSTFAFHLSQGEGRGKKEGGEEGGTASLEEREREREREASGGERDRELPAALTPLPWLHSKSRTICRDVLLTFPKPERGERILPLLISPLTHSLFPETSVRSAGAGEIDVFNKNAIRHAEKITRPSD